MRSKRRSFIIFWIVLIVSWRRVVILWFYSLSKIVNLSLFSQAEDRSFWVSYSCFSLQVIFTDSWQFYSIMIYIRIVCYILDKKSHTYLLRVSVYPLPLLTFLSKIVFIWYRLLPGEIAVFLVTSTLFPYPIIAPVFLLLIYDPR